MNSNQTLWSAEEISFLNEHILKPTYEITALFSSVAQFPVRSYNSIQKKVKRLRDIRCIEPEELEDNSEEVVLEFEDNSAHLGLPRVTAAEKRAARQDAKEWLREIIDFAQEEVRLPQQPRTIQTNNNSLVLILSDLHYGKHTDIFDLATAKDRILSIPSLLEKKVLHHVDEIVVVLLGDIVEGEDIYLTQNGVIECPVFEQTQRATEDIWKLLTSLRKEFNVPIRVETVPGNHGRMSKTANEKSNWDNVVYYILKVMSSMYKDKDIFVNANYNMFQTFDVKTKKVGIYHEGIKHTGTPAMQVKIAGWAISKEIEMLCHGHWHKWGTSTWTDKVIVANGSLCGPDDLAERMAQSDSAKQAWFLVNPEEGFHNFNYLEWSE